MKLSKYLAVFLALLVVLSCALGVCAAEETEEEYLLLKSDGFEGDACTLQTSNMLSNPQSYLWDNVFTIDGDDPKAIDGNGLLFQFENMTNDNNRWVSPLRIDASKVDIRNGFYTITLQLRSAGIRTYHFQLKTLAGDVLVGEYYFDANTLETLDTGNRKPVIGTSSMKDGITEVVLDFGSVPEVYVDVTMQVDVNSAERYTVLDNVQLHGLQLADYPQLTYETYRAEEYSQTTGIWSKGEKCDTFEVQDGKLYAKGTAKKSTLMKSESIALEEGYYKVYFQIKPEKINSLRLDIYCDDVLLHEVSYDIKSESTGITRDPIEIALSKDRVTGCFALSVCFQNKTDSNFRFEIYVEGENKTPVLQMKSFDVLKSFENEFSSEQKPAKAPQQGQLNPQYGAVNRVQGGNGLVVGLIIAASAVAVVAVAVVIVIVVRKRGKKNENEK